MLESSSTPESPVHRFEAAAGEALTAWRQKWLEKGYIRFLGSEALASFDFQSWEIWLTANRRWVTHQITPGSDSDSKTLFEELSAACGNDDATRQLLATAGEDDIAQMIATALYGDTPAASKMVDVMVTTARAGQQITDAEVRRRINQGEIEFGFFGPSNSRSLAYSSLLGLFAAARELTKPSSQFGDLGNLAVYAARELRSKGEYTGVIPLPIFNQLVGQALDRADLPAPLGFDLGKRTKTKITTIDSSSGKLAIGVGRFIQLSPSKSKPVEFVIDVAMDDERKLRVTGTGADRKSEFKVRLPASGFVGRVRGKTEYISDVLWGALGEGRLHTLVQAELTGIFAAGGIEVDAVGFGFDDDTSPTAQLTLTLKSTPPTTETLSPPKTLEERLAQPYSGQEPLPSNVSISAWTPEALEATGDFETAERVCSGQVSLVHIEAQNLAQVLQLVQQDSRLLDSDRVYFADFYWPDGTKFNHTVKVSRLRRSAGDVDRFIEEEAQDFGQRTDFDKGQWRTVLIQFAATLGKQPTSTPEMTQPVVFAPWQDAELTQAGVTITTGERFLQVTGATNLGEVMTEAKALTDDYQPTNIVLFIAPRPDGKLFGLKIPLAGLRQTSSVEQLIQLMAQQLEKTKAEGGFTKEQWRRALEKFAAGLGTKV